MTKTREVLSDAHQELIAKSRISPEVVAARGYRTVTTKAYLEELGFTKAQRRVPALVMPIYNVRGEIALYQSRPDDPRIANGKPVKYETPGGAQLVPDFPPAVRVKVGDPSIPLYITEGVRKADAAVSRGICCIDILGVWGWRYTNAFGGKVAHADWDSVALNDRLVRIVFDSDVMTKWQVHAALVRFSDFLKNRGARIEFVYLPPGPEGEKTGLDDYLAAGHSIVDLKELATSELKPSPSRQDEAIYEARESGLIHWRQTRDGRMAIPLTNFTATIVAEVVHDDGVETARLFEVETAKAGKKGSFTVPVSRFGEMSWVLEHLGAGAVVNAGMGVRDHARAAIQVLSGSPPLRTVYTHTGWREIDGEWRYLHGGGTVGTLGTIPTTQVALMKGASLYILPEPPTGEALALAVKKSLQLLRIGPARLLFPLYASIWRAALGASPFALHLFGMTGVFKTELAALLQQHFGAGMDAAHLPGSWISTANANELLAFTAKDAVLVIDDFAPAGSIADLQRAARDAERLFRGQGNRSGRARLRADGSFKAARESRALIISTGEELPPGQSLRARILMLEVRANDIPSAALSQCQNDARRGFYAQALAAFLQWTSGRYTALISRLSSRTADIRKELELEGHRRIPNTIAHLLAGMEIFSEFALEAGAITEPERQQLLTEAKAALVETAELQLEHQASSDPAKRFLDLISSVLASGNGHLAAIEEEVPENARAWGWRYVDQREWKPSGERIGWLGNGELLLDPSTAYRAAQKMASHSPDGISISMHTLWKRLKEGGFLLETDEKRGRNTVRRVIEGQRRDVLALPMGAFSQDKPSQSSQTSQSNTPPAQTPDSDHHKSPPGPAAGSDREVGEI